MLFEVGDETVPPRARLIAMCEGGIDGFVDDLFSAMFGANPIPHILLELVIIDVDVLISVFFESFEILPSESLIEVVPINGEQDAMSLRDVCGFESGVSDNFLVAEEPELFQFL